MAKADELETDLVEIAPKATPPVCRLMDYGKFKYAQSKKMHEAKTKQKNVQVKEIKFRPGTDDNDYNIKLRNLIKFLGGLDSSIKNPRKKLLFIDEEGMANNFNFIYYNNKFHSPQGTRNEYRLTGMTAYLRRYNAQSGAELELSRLDGEDYYRVSLIKEKTRESEQAGASNRIKLSGWRSVH